MNKNAKSKKVEYVVQYNSVNKWRDFVRMHDVDSAKKYEEIFFIFPKQKHRIVKRLIIEDVVQ